MTTMAIARTALTSISPTAGVWASTLGAER